MCTNEMAIRQHWKAVKPLTPSSPPGKAQDTWHSLTSPQKLQICLFVFHFCLWIEREAAMGAATRREQRLHPQWPRLAISLREAHPRSRNRPPL